MKVNEHFSGWSRLSAVNKADRLSKFFSKYKKELGHIELDAVCAEIFTYCDDEDEEEETP